VAHEQQTHCNKTLAILNSRNYATDLLPPQCPARSSYRLGIINDRGNRPKDFLWMRVRAIYYIRARDTHFLIDTDEWRLNWNVLVSLRGEPEFRERGMI